MHSKYMEVSIIIPTTADRDKIFSRTLISVLEAIDNIDAEIIIISDTPGYVPTVPLNATKVTLYNSPGKGVAAARNFGAGIAKSNLLLFLDNDIIMSEASLKATLQLHRDDPGIVVNPDWVYPEDLQLATYKTNFGRFLNAYNMTTEKGWYGPGWQDNALFESPTIASFHLSIPKDVYEKTGGYNTSFPSAGFEDFDFSQRLTGLGTKVFIDSRILVLHNEADKLNVHTRLRTQEIRSTTRKIASVLGYSSTILNYGPLKKTILEIIYFFHEPMVWILEKLPVNKFCFGLYKRAFIAVEASVIYKGYSKDVSDLLKAN